LNAIRTFHTFYFRFIVCLGFVKWNLERGHPLKLERYRED